MFLAKLICYKVNCYIICFGDAAAYLVYVCMLYPLQGGRATGYCVRTQRPVDRPPCKGYNIHTYTRYAAASPKHMPYFPARKSHFFFPKK